jgi:hypothetical protein
MEDMNQLQAKLRRAQFRLPGTWLPAVRFSIGFPRLGRLRPGVLFGSGDFGRRRPPPHPVIVTEQHADPVELIFQAFLRLEPEQRARLIQRLKWRWGGPPKPPSPKGAR